MTSHASTRRSFIQTAGAALSAPLAAAASVPVAAAGETPEARLARLEDVAAIRALHRDYVKQVNTGGSPELQGVSADGFGEHDVIDISDDRQTATARFHCTLHFETAIGPDCPLVDMARQQGGGVIRRSEPGFVEHAIVRRDGAWAIERSAWHLSSSP